MSFPAESDLTTFVERFPNGVEMHRSTPATELDVLDDRTLEEAAVLTGFYDHYLDPCVETSMSIQVNARSDLTKLPPANPKAPNRILHPILQAFASHIATNRPAIIGNDVPYLLRAMAFGPESSKTPAWHCDPISTFDVVDRMWISRTPPGARRVVVGLDGKLRPKVPANIQFVDGLFLVDKVEAEPKTTDTNRFHDYSSLATIVSRRVGSIVHIGDPTFSPEPGTVRQFGQAVMTDLPSTCLHAPYPISDSVRYSLQLFIKKPFL